MAILGIEPASKQEEFQLQCMERDADRGLFCTEGFDLRKGVRKKMRRIFTEQPKCNKLWIELSQGLNGNADKVAETFTQYLPRSEEEAVDPRYFGVHWGLGTVLQYPGLDDVSLAASYYRHALLQYADQARPNHYTQAVDLMKHRLHSGEQQASTMLMQALDNEGDDDSSMNRRETIMQLFQTLEVADLKTDRLYTKNRTGYRKY